MALACSITFTACNNGDYDVRPDEDLSITKNPLVPPKDGNPGVGEFIAKVGGAWRLFENAYYVDTMGTRTIVGSYELGGKTNVLAIRLKDFDSARLYDFDQTSLNRAEYSEIITANPTTYKQFSTANPIRTGDGNITVEFDGADIMFGSFKLKAYLVLPKESQGEKIDITEGRFNVKKL